jgi:putative transposase
LIGVRADGTQELVALTDGHRESSESWADLLRDCKCRGMAAPVLAIGDGALGFWAALRDVFPATREQRKSHDPPIRQSRLLLMCS